MRYSRAIVATLCGALLLGALATCGGIVWFGSARNALAYLRGDVVILDRNPYELGHVKGAKQTQFEISATNISGKSIRIVGAQTPCSCIHVGDLPKTIAPGLSATIPVEINYGKASGQDSRVIILLTDSENQPTVAARLHATIDRPIESEAVSRETQAKSQAVSVLKH